MAIILGSEYSTNTLLRAVGFSDAEFIFHARQEASRNEFLSPVTGNVENQKEWLREYGVRHEAGLEYYFIIEDKNIHPWGMIRVYNIERNDGTFTIGSWLILPGAPKLMAQESTAICYEFAFHRLNLEKCRFDVMQGNRKVIRFHRCYATEVSSDRDFIHFEFTREQFEKSIFPQFLGKLTGE